MSRRYPGPLYKANPRLVSTSLRYQTEASARPGFLQKRPPLPSTGSGGGCLCFRPPLPSTGSGGGCLCLRPPLPSTGSGAGCLCFRLPLPSTGSGGGCLCFRRLPSTLGGLPLRRLCLRQAQARSRCLRQAQAAAASFDLLELGAYCLRQAQAAAASVFDRLCLRQAQAAAASVFDRLCLRQAQAAAASVFDRLCLRQAQAAAASVFDRLCLRQAQAAAAWRRRLNLPRSEPVAHGACRSAEAESTATGFRVKRLLRSSQRFERPPRCHDLQTILKRPSDWPLLLRALPSCACGLSPCVRPPKYNVR